MPLDGLVKAMQHYGLPVTVEVGNDVPLSEQERKKGGRLLTTWAHSEEYHFARIYGLRALLVREGILKKKENEFLRDMTPEQAEELLRILRDAESV